MDMTYHIELSISKKTDEQKRMHLVNDSKRELDDLLYNADHPLKIPPFAFLLPLIVFPLVCALFRKQRLRSTLEDFPYTTRRSFASMTQSDAFYIQQRVGELEFPFTYEKGLQFALFRTYGIPSISKLLVQTTELAKEETATKRYTDTVVLVSDFTTFHPRSARAREAVSRMNYIHSLYIKSEKISNDDLQYTLSLFVWEPARWIDRHEWRRLEDFEKCAFGTFWKGVGDAMSIDFGRLKSSSDGWVDGLQWMEELAEWAEEYEEAHMVPHKDNHETAEQTVATLLYSVPSWGKAFGKTVVTVLMDDRLRRAMMYDAPPRWLVYTTHFILDARKYVLRYFWLPRLSFLPRRVTSKKPSKDGTFFLTKQDTAPWYVKPTIWNRYGPASWLTRLMGLPLPGDGGQKYFPNGYRIPEVGPVMLRSKGAEFMKNDKEKVAKAMGGGCPFSRMKAE